MQTCHKDDLYDPLKLLSFTIDFSTSANDEPLVIAANKTIEHLSHLDDIKLLTQAYLFMKWLIVYNVSSHAKYAQMLLDFFHSRNLLLHKKSIVTEKKQSKPKYVVIYNMPDNVFSKMYSSVREMREDTGKKPSVLAKYQI